jgi:hypothetical protein
MGTMQTAYVWEQGAENLWISKEYNSEIEKTAQ